MAEKTIFQKIIDREIPADILWENQEIFLLLDINPVRKGHILLISKNPYPTMQDVPDELIGKMFVQAKFFMKLLKQEFACDYVHMIVEGIEVPHFHIHLIPSFLKEENARWHHELYETPEEKQSYIEKIKSAL